MRSSGTRGKSSTTSSAKKGGKKIIETPDQPGISEADLIFALNTAENISFAELEAEAHCIRRAQQLYNDLSLENEAATVLALQIANDCIKEEERQTADAILAGTRALENAHVTAKSSIVSARSALAEVEAATAAAVAMAVRIINDDQTRAIRATEESMAAAAAEVARCARESAAITTVAETAGRVEVNNHAASSALLAMHADAVAAQVREADAAAARGADELAAQVRRAVLLGRW